MDNLILTGKQPILEILIKSPNKIEKIWIQKNRHKNVKKIIEICQNNKLKYQFVPKEKLDKITQGKHQGFAAKIFSPGFIQDIDLITLLNKSKLPLIIALDQIQDQGNIGAIARTLYSLGGTGLIVPKYRSVQLGERAFKASAGALYHLPIAMTTNLKNFFKLCHKKRIYIYYSGIEESSCIDLYRAKILFPSVLILGNEEKGIRPSIKKFCNQGLKIPMLRNFNSLNVAQAGAIFIGEFLRRKIEIED